MKNVSKLTADVLDFIEPYIVPGVTTKRLDSLCHEYIVNTLQAIPVNIGYNGFPATICTSPNHVVCHGVPGDKILKKGDIDVAIVKDGFHGDSSRMYFVGKPAIFGKRISDVRYDIGRIYHDDPIFFHYSQLTDTPYE